jgi:hypothetical protein
MTNDFGQKANEAFRGDEAELENADIWFRKDSLDWSSIIETSVIDPKLKEQALELIEFHFGYLPIDEHTTPYLPSISSLIQNYHAKLIDRKKMLLMSEICLLQLRNRIVALHSLKKYPSSTYEEYSYLPAEYKIRAKQRFAKFLGYEPSTEAAIQCELAASSLLSADTNNIGDELSSADCQMFLIIAYREELLERGKKHADVSPLPINAIKTVNNISISLSF